MLKIIIKCKLFTLFSSKYFLINRVNNQFTIQRVKLKRKHLNIIGMKTILMYTTHIRIVNSNHRNNYFISLLYLREDNKGLN